MEQQDKNKSIENEKNKLEITLAKTKKVTRLLTMVGVFATVIGIFSLTYTVKNLTKEKTEIKDSLNIKIVDSIKQKEAIAYAQNDTIKDFVLEFLNAEKNELNLRKYYSPVIKSHYQRRNVPISYIIKNKERFSRDNPRAKFDFKKDDIIVNTEKVDTADIIVNGLYYPDSINSNFKKIIYKIGLDTKNKKIFSIAQYDFKSVQ